MLAHNICMEAFIMWVIVIFLVGYLAGFIYWYFVANDKEGMTNPSTQTDGIAGNGASYKSSVKMAVEKLQDTLLVNKYQSDYETVVLELDNLVNNLLLKKALTINLTDPERGLIELGELSRSKEALNSIMSYIDQQ